LIYDSVSESLLLACFFFQAEDGIRGLVRSRGLGDVYKRQTLIIPVIQYRIPFVNYLRDKGVKGAISLNY